MYFSTNELREVISRLFYSSLGKKKNKKQKTLQLSEILAMFPVLLKRLIKTDKNNIKYVDWEFLIIPTYQTHM